MRAKPTVVFAREEVNSSDVPSYQFEYYYHSIVFPAKQQLNDDQMARATFASDVKLVRPFAPKRSLRWFSRVACKPHSQRLTAAGDLLLLVAIGEEAIVADSLPVVASVLVGAAVPGNLSTGRTRLSRDR